MVCMCLLQVLWVICAWWYLNGGCGSEEHATLTVLAYQTPSTYYSSRGMVAQEYTDTMLVTYLATLTKGADGLNEAIDKLSLVNTGGTSGRYMVIDTCFTSLIPCPRHVPPRPLCTYSNKYVCRPVYALLHRSYVSTFTHMYIPLSLHHRRVCICMP